jgi:hypothetical protein
LATTVVYLKDYSGAVEAARKANKIRTWKGFILFLKDKIFI